MYPVPSHLFISSLSHILSLGFSFHLLSPLILILPPFNLPSLFLLSAHQFISSTSFIHLFSFLIFSHLCSPSPLFISSPLSLICYSYSLTCSTPPFSHLHLLSSLLSSVDLFFTVPHSSSFLLPSQIIISHVHLFFSPLLSTFHLLSWRGTIHLLPSHLFISLLCCHPLSISSPLFFFLSSLSLICSSYSPICSSPLLISHFSPPLFSSVLLFSYLLLLFSHMFISSSVSSTLLIFSSSIHILSSPLLLILSSPLCKLDLMSEQQAAQIILSINEWA